MSDIELCSMGTAPPSHFTDMIVKLPRPISEDAFKKVVQWVQFLRKCSNQQFDNMLEELEMAKDGLMLAGGSEVEFTSAAPGAAPVIKDERKA